MMEVVAIAKNPVVFLTAEMVETDIIKRWSEGIPHHPKSEEIVRAVAKVGFSVW